MADNVTLPGTGLPVETLDIGAGVERQVVTISPRNLSAVDSIGSLTETAPASDTASSGLNGRLQRIAQRLTTLITNVAPAAWTFGAGATAAGTPRVAIASDSPGIIPTGTQASPSASYLSTVAAGDIAHDAADSGNPAKIGAKAIAGLSTATLVAAADRTQLYSGLDGALINRPHCGLEDIVTGNATNTDGTSTQCIAAQAAGIKVYLTSMVLANTSATAITVDIKDGSTTKVSLPLPAGSGCIFNPPVPIPGTAATAWNFDPSAAATTVTCSMVGFKSKV